MPNLRLRSIPTAIVACALALAALTCAPAAGAVMPSAATVVNHIVTQPGAADLGTLTFRTTFTDTTASASATATPLRLALGPTYRIRTCVWEKAPAAAPDSVCETAETRPNAVTIATGVAAPVARMTVERPAAGQPAATIAGTVLVDIRQTDGTYSSRGSSWPADGLPAAGIAVPAADQAAAPVLGPQGVALPGVPGGGINSGTQDSICREDQVPATTPDEGSTTALGDLPFAYEVGEPPAGPVRGVMLILHGGAWSSVGRAKLSITRGDAERWRARGWRTVNATYRPCAASVADVLSLYDRVRQTYGSALPICAFGRSAGGQLALLLAARRSKLACVVSEAGLADLAALPREQAAAGATGPGQVANWATAAFGADRLADVSAAGSPVKARVLYAIGAADTLVPWAQATDFAAAQRRRDPTAYVDTLRLAAGNALFEHAFVSDAALDEFHAREQALVEPLVTGDVVAPPTARLRLVRANGLRARFTCAARCKVAARLRLSARTASRLGLPRVAGRGSASRASRGRGTLTVRLTAAARAKLGTATLQLVSDVTAGGMRHRQTARVVLRRS
jgi:dienelactone hydrolase